MSQKIFIRPQTRKRTDGIKEKNSYFLCPSNTVLTGRCHSGDENGKTWYEYSTLAAFDENNSVVQGNIIVDDIQWSPWFKESSGNGYDAIENRVLVGRQHNGDENGETGYAIGEVFFNGFPTTIIGYEISAPLHESDGVWFNSDKDHVVTGRHHYGDENGTTYYGVGIISCDARKDSNEEVVIHVKHDSEEKYLPMNPEDYVRLCRLRRHNGGGASDDGFNKETKTFVNGNAKTKEYYDIPISLLSTFHLYGKHELLNLRPKDINSIGTGELFLQPDDHLNGTLEPNGRVAAMKYSDKNKISYWLFWGYDLAEVDILGFGYPKLKGNHEGDWEHLIIELDENNRIKSATLSQHTSTVTYNASELEIVHGATKDELTVYCANGSHALYNKPGTFSDNVKIGHDVADGLGCDWVITDEVKSLNDDSTPWKYFSGGWGEVGNFAFTTGPLGPWQKCGGLEKEVQKHNSPSVDSLIKEDELLLVYDSLKKRHVPVKKAQERKCVRPKTKCFTPESIPMMKTESLNISSRGFMP